MIRVEPSKRETLRSLFLPDRPGPLVGLHVIQTGLGELLADRWPDARVAIARAGQDRQIAGDPAALDVSDLRALGLERGMFDAPAEFEPLLEAAFPGIWRWHRVIARLQGEAPPAAPDGRVRQLQANDARRLAALDEQIAWIWAPWESPRRLAASGLAYGAFEDGRLVSVATAFHLGARFEELGVVTEPEFRCRGFNTACVARVVADVRGRGRQPSWSTSPDNSASLRVAQKFGARKHRDDVLYMIGPDPSA